MGKSKTDKEALKEMRKLRGLSMKNAANLFGVSVATIKWRESRNFPLPTTERSQFIDGYGFSKTDFINLKLSFRLESELGSKNMKLA